MFSSAIKHRSSKGLPWNIRRFAFRSSVAAIVLFGLQESPRRISAIAVATTSVPIQFSQAATADLSVSANASHDPIATGSQLIYTVRVSNAGPDQAEAMINVLSALPAGTRIVSVEASRPALCTTETRDLTGPMNCSFFRFVPGDSVVITYVVEVTAPAGSVLKNTVTVNTNSAAVTDPNLDNNSVTITTQVMDPLCAIVRLQNISAVGEPSLQCGAVVNYSMPATTGECREVNCTPTSGSVFFPGATRVVCATTDRRGVAYVSTFNVTIDGRPEMSIDATSFDFGPVTLRRKPVKHPPSAVFTLENKGCEAYSAFLGLSRSGRDVDSGRISNTIDTQFFSLYYIRPDAVETPVPIYCDVECPLRVAPGERKSFRLTFTPQIPAVSDRTSGLAASEVLPDVLTATLRLGNTFAINLLGRVSTSVILINPKNPRKPALVTFARSDNEFVVQFSVYDSNLDVNRAIVQFLDSTGRPVLQSFDVELAETIRQRNLLTGQSFTVTQRFTGARSHPEVTGVRVTVIDGEASDMASSIP